MKLLREKNKKWWKEKAQKKNIEVKRSQKKGKNKQKQREKGPINQQRMIKWKRNKIIDGKKAKINKNKEGEKFKQN